MLRLQKLHVIVGQDTDSESTPYGAAMPWIVKLDKEQDFIGRWALEHAAEHPARARARRLHDGQRPRADRGRRRAAGRARGTSVARARRQLGKVIGMAWVPSAQASDGATITISDEAAQYTATVTTSPFFDPEGEVLRS